MQGNVGNQFQTVANKCNLCFGEYDRRAKQPLIICSMNHTICAECMRSIERNPKCPFCREAIIFGRIVVNQAVFELLPHEISHLPSKHSLKRTLQAPQNRLQRQIAIQTEFSKQNRLNKQPRQFQNRQPGYFNQQTLRNTPPSNLSKPSPLLNVNAHQSQLHPAHEESNKKECCSCIQISNSDRPLVHALIFFGQLPFMVTDFLIALLSEQSECMDIAHQSPILVLRVWLYICFYCSLASIIILGVSCRGNDRGIMSGSVFRVMEIISVFIFGLKVTIWAMIQLQMMKITFIPYCTGGIFAYGVILTIYHSILIAIVFIKALLQGRCFL